MQRLAQLHEAAGHVSGRAHSRLEVSSDRQLSPTEELTEIRRRLAAGEFSGQEEEMALAQTEAALDEDVAEMCEEEMADQASRDTKRLAEIRLTSDQERTLWRDLPKIVGGFSRQATTPSAKRVIEDRLEQMIRDRLRPERDDTERRRLLLQFTANLLAPARAPEGLDDARNLLANTASQEALDAAIKAASEQQRPIPTPQPSPGPRPGPGMTM